MDITRYNIIKKQQYNRVAYFSIVLFLISPFAALPIIIYDIYKHRRGALLCFAMFMGILTYLLLPDWSLDLARYYVRYEEISTLNIREFIEYITGSDDFVFYILFFTFSSFGMKFQILIFCLTTFNYFVVFYVFDNVAKRFSIKDKLYFQLFVLLFLSISLIYYLSATRFVLASSFLILFVYNLYYSHNKKRAILFIFASIVTHIGMLFYIPFIMIIPNIKNKNILVLISILLLGVAVFIPLNSILDALSSIIPAFSMKALVYLEIIREEGTWPVISHYGSIIIGLLFVLRFYKIMSQNILNLYMFVFLAVSSTLPLHFIVYDRFIIVFKIVFVLVLVEVSFHLKTKMDKLAFSILKVFLLGFYFLHFIYSAYFYRANFSNLLELDNLFLITILLKSYNINDIFYL